MAQSCLAGRWCAASMAAVGQSTQQSQPENCCQFVCHAHLGQGTLQKLKCWLLTSSSTAAELHAHWAAAVEARPTCKWGEAASTALCRTGASCCATSSNAANTKRNTASMYGCSTWKCGWSHCGKCGTTASNGDVRCLLCPALGPAPGSIELGSWNPTMYVFVTNRLPAGVVHCMPLCCSDLRGMP